MKSSNCGLKLLFYIRGNNGLCKNYILETVGSLLKAKRTQQKDTDMAAKPLPTIQAGQAVQIQQKDKTWKPGT